MSATPDSGSPASDKAALAYDRIDSFLRNNLDDSDYADYSEALETVYAHPPAALPERCGSDSAVCDTQAALSLADERQAALPGGGLAAAERLIRLRKNVGNAEYERQCDDWLAHLKRAAP